jgi:hypothetical protein
MPVITEEIDLAAEIAAGKGVSLIELARLHGVNPSTAFRWAIKGLPSADGARIKLSAIKRGKRWLTTAAAVAQFFSALPVSTPTLVASPIRTPAKRQSDCERAKKHLADKYKI